jgi:hypothetical protein
MAVCRRCDGEMLDGVSCSPGREAIPYGGESRYPVRLPEACHDCAVPLGGFHHSRCDMEQCPECGGQRITCGHDREPLITVES